MKSDTGSSLLLKVSKLTAVTSLMLVTGMIAAQSVRTGAEQAIQQSVPRVVAGPGSAVTGAGVRGRLTCPATINVKVDDVQSNPPWIQSPAAARFVRAETGFINRSTPQIAVCVYTAFGGEFKIQRSLDQVYESCSVFTTQGGTGGVQCQ